MKYAPPIGQEAQGEDAHYIDGNPELGILGSPVPAAALEPVQRELVHVIRQAGLDPAAEDLTQIWQAICKIIGIKAPLATLLRAGLMQPDGKTATVDGEGLLSALGGNLLLNSGLWLTESGEWEVPVDGWYHVLCIAGGQGSFCHSTGRWGFAGQSGEWKEGFVYLHAGETVDVVVGSGGKQFYGTTWPGPGQGGGYTEFAGVTAYGAFAGSGPGRAAFVYGYNHAANNGNATGTYQSVASALGPGGTEGAPWFYGAGGGCRLEQPNNTFSYYIYDGYQGAVRLRWHDPALAAGPLPAPALLKARRMAPRAAEVPETVRLYAPETGQGSVWRAEDAEAKLAEGLISAEAWQEICDARAAEDHAAWLASPETEAERFQLLRLARDARLSATDYLVAPDYPLTEEQRTAVISYRQALRDLPAQEGAPWDGGGEATPWPGMPAVAKVQEAQ